MKLSYLPLPDEHFFAENKRVEFFYRKIIFLVLGLILVFLLGYWEELGSQKFIKSLVAVSSEYRAVEYLFRGFTFLADNEFFIILFSVLIWCFNKTLGYTLAVVILFAGGYNTLLKEIFALSRPALEGISLPTGYAFPSGHTLLGVVSWGFLSLKIRKKGFWTWSLFAMAMIGLSRLMLGYHFVRDVLGGLLFGVLFLAILLFIAPAVNREVEKIRLSSSWLMFLAILIPLVIIGISEVVLQREGVILFMGYISGAVFGYACTEKAISPAAPGGKGFLQLLKIIIGTAGLIVIVWGIPAVVPGRAFSLFPFYFLAGLWASLLAPLIFMRLGLSVNPGRQDTS